MPYQRDAGMTETAARRLADLVHESAIGAAFLKAEGRFFVVSVTTTAGETLTLRDEADWRWLQAKVAEPPRS